MTEAQEWPEQSRIFRLQDYLAALKYMPQTEIRQLSPDADGYSVVMMENGTPGDSARSITYDAGGVRTLDGWYIHLAVMPLHQDRSSSGDETIHLFMVRRRARPVLPSPNGWITPRPRMR